MPAYTMSSSHPTSHPSTSPELHVQIARPSTASSSARPSTSHDPQTYRRPPSSRRRRRPPTARLDTAATSASGIGDLPDQQFFPEGDEFSDEEEDFYEEPDEDVFAFERPVTGAVPPAGFSGSEYTASVPGTGLRTIQSGQSLSGPSNYAGPSTSGHSHLHREPSQTSPEVTATGQMEALEAASSVPELTYDPRHPPVFSGTHNLNNSSFAFMNKLHRESQSRLASRPQTGESLLSKLHRRALNTGTTEQSATTNVTGMTRLDSNDTSDINSIDTSFMEASGGSRTQSKSHLIPPSTAGGTTEYSTTTFQSTAGSQAGSRGLMSRGSYGMTELTGDMTVPDGKTTWGDGMVGAGAHKESEAGSMAGMDVDMLEEDSPYPEVRASVSNIDDPEMPGESGATRLVSLLTLRSCAALTFRAWFLGLLFTVLGSACNTFFAFRTPAPYISPFIVQIIAFPSGKFLAWLLPIRTFYLPRWLGGGEFTFNPGPFNIKEHALIAIMANVSLSSAYALYVVVSTELWYGKNMGIGFSILFIFVTQLTGFSFAGLCRRFVVWPASMIWPSNLVVATNLNTFHAEDETFQGGMSRFKFLLIAGGSAFAYYFLPGFLFTALSYFSFICWIAPQNKIVNELFGVSTGLGLSILTFDWSQISWVGSPLTIPWWAQVNIGIGFLLLYWIVVPILYYTNVSGHLRLKNSC